MYMAPKVDLTLPSSKPESIIEYAEKCFENFDFEVNACGVPCPGPIMKLAKKMKARGIRPELEAFDLGMINYAKYLIRKDLIPQPYYFNLILGNIACAQANMLSLGLMLKELPEGAIWSVGGIGDWQLQMNAMALIAGGGSPGRT